MVELCEKYHSILQEFLAQRSEAVLYRASKLGKDLVERGIGPEEIVEVHGRAVQKALGENPCLKNPSIILDSTNLLLEVIMAYGLAYREYMELKVREMDNLQLYTKKLEESNCLLEQKLKELRLIHQFSCTFSQVLKTKETAKLIVDQISLVIPYKGCALYLWGSNKDTLKNLAAAGEPLPPLQIVHEHKKSCWNQKQGILTIPLLMDQKALGFLVLSLEGGEPDQELLHLLAIISNQAAFALTRALMHEKIWKQSITDCKTGLYNFHHFQKQCEKKITQDKQLAILMLDLDDFKSFNDNFGHLKGDQALAAIGREIRKIIRKEDIAARYGGEEFVIALPETGYNQAWQVAERIRQSISQLEVSVPGKLTTSIGLAISPTDGTTFEQLLSQADKALYQAKEQGKNKICSASRR